MSANALDQGLVSTLVGGAIGVAVAFGLGAAVYYGAARIDLKLFFAATSIALLMLASRFFGIGILELGEAGVVALPEVIEETLELLEEGAVATRESRGHRTPAGSRGLVAGSQPDIVARSVGQDSGAETAPSMSRGASMNVNGTGPQGPVPVRLRYISRNFINS